MILNGWSGFLGAGAGISSASSALGFFSALGLSCLGFFSCLALGAATWAAPTSSSSAQRVTLPTTSAKALFVTHLSNHAETLGNLPRKAPSQTNLKGYTKDETMVMSAKVMEDPTR